MNDSVAILERRLEYQFREPALLVQALTHRSLRPAHNERLEFLGDGLLNFVIAEVLYRNRPRADEGELSRLRASLVREEALAGVARRIEIGEHLGLGGGELKSGGFRRASILADALEAILGAVFLDADFVTARAICLRLFAPEIDALPETKGQKDAKTRLQEFLQSKGRRLPEYAVMEEIGPPHDRIFRVRCHLVGSELEAQGSGVSRKIAEQVAAELMLAILYQEDS